MESICQVTAQSVPGLGNVYSMDIDLNETDKRTITFIGEYKRNNTNSRLGLGESFIHSLIADAYKDNLSEDAILQKVKWLIGMKQYERNKNDSSRRLFFILEAFWVPAHFVHYLALQHYNVEPIVIETWVDEVELKSRYIYECYYKLRSPEATPFVTNSTCTKKELEEIVTFCKKESVDYVLLHMADNLKEWEALQNLHKFLLPRSLEPLVDKIVRPTMLW